MPKIIFSTIGLGLLASLLAFLPWSFLLPTLLVTGGLLFLLRWPWLSWLGLAASLPLSSALKFSGLSLTEVLVAATIWLWFVDGVRRRTLPLRGAWLLIGPLLYGVALYLATFQAADLGEAAREVIKWLEFAAVILLVRSSLPAPSSHWLALALLLGGVGQAILGLYQFIFRVGPDWFIIMGRFMRASGSFQQPNPYGGYLGLTLPVAVSLALWAWGAFGQSFLKQWRLNHWQRPTDRSFTATQQSMGEISSSLFICSLWALLYTAAAGLIAAGLFASWSRGAWLGAGLALTVVVVVRSRRSAMLGGVAFLGLLLALLLGAFQPSLIPPSLAQRLQDLPAYLGFTDVLNQPVTDENFAVMERLAHWVAAWRMWERSPWLGIGPGNFDQVYPMVRLPRWDVSLGHAHNIYLNVLAESGLVGLSAFVLFWGLTGWWVIRNLRPAIAQNSWNQALAVGVLGVLIHLSVHSFFDNLFVQGIYLHLALWLGLVGQAGVEPKLLK